MKEEDSSKRKPPRRGDDAGDNPNRDIASEHANGSKPPKGAKAPNFKTTDHKGRLKTLEIGSDVEIARRVRNDLIQRYGLVVHAEGAFWHYRKTHWDAIVDHELRLVVHPYDGAFYYPPADRKPSVVKLGKGRINSIINECATLCADPQFFDERQVGINCASGFIRFAADGTATLEPHDPAHRCRHTLPGHWHVDANAKPP